MACCVVALMCKGTSTVKSPCTCVGQEDELVVLLEDIVIFGVQVGQAVLPREPATKDAGVKAAPDVSILHVSHLGEVSDVECNPIGRLLQD